MKPFYGSQNFQKKQKNPGIEDSFCSAFEVDKDFFEKSTEKNFSQLPDPLETVCKSGKLL